MWIEDDRDLLNGDHVSVYKENPENTVLHFNDNYIGCIHVQMIPELTSKYTEIDIIKSKDIDYLSNYTDEQLKDELDKRKLTRKEAKENILRCRHCANFDYGNRPVYCQQAYCTKQVLTNKKGIKRFRIVNKSAKAWALFDASSKEFAKEPISISQE